MKTLELAFARIRGGLIRDRSVLNCRGEPLYDGSAIQADFLDWWSIELAGSKGDRSDGNDTHENAKRCQKDQKSFFHRCRPNRIRVVASTPRDCKLA
jgi:hypothetical protein